MKTIIIKYTWNGYDSYSLNQVEKGDTKKKFSHDNEGGCIYNFKGGLKIGQYMLSFEQNESELPTNFKKITKEFAEEIMQNKNRAFDIMKDYFDKE